MQRLALAFAALFAFHAFGQVGTATPGWFVFDVPGLDVPANSPVDLAFLNAEAAGAHGFLRVENGHFVDGAGQRVRLIGTNVTGDSCFPDPEQAERLARRLSQWGFNCLRLHFMDFNRSGSIWEDPAAGTLSEEQLRRLDVFAAACARHGIYLNVNLHVSREYPGQPEIPGSLRLRMGKTIDRWHEPYVAMIEDYARALLDRKNSVTGIRWADDPAVCSIEINNENTMIGDFRADYRNLPEPWRGDFTGKWNAWLKAKYGTDEALRQAWNREVQPLGEELLGSNWSVETAGTAESQLSNENGVLRWSATKPGTAFWHLQMQYKDLRLPPGRYTFRFRARSRTGNGLPQSHAEP
jgi:hypothetical protein